MSLDDCGRPELLNSFCSNNSLALSHVALPEEELPIEVAGLYSVHVNLQYSSSGWSAV